MPNPDLPRADRGIGLEQSRSSKETIMKEGRSLSDLASEIERQVKAKKDVIVTTTKLAFEPPVVVGGPELMRVPEFEAPKPVNDLALQQIGERNGIPNKYLRRM